MMPRLFLLSRRFTIDLRGIATRDDFTRELAETFKIAPDWANLWSTFLESVDPRRRVHRVRGIGWAEFQRRMPRYAHRMERVFRFRERLWGKANFSVKYSER